eukprot:TRINITY_DN24925_c0_g1_i2.p1 TRINITY_DN24925_c0_g1~~TRINITY_DN24925_c0_g1_i2.p1  ORF type:complete len:201 (-),score=47.64 TRINITY_DN24925_c0_g1_i2:6-608(-)
MVHIRLRKLCSLCAVLCSSTWSKALGAQHVAGESREGAELLDGEQRLMRSDSVRREVGAVNEKGELDFGLVGEQQESESSDSDDWSEKKKQFCIIDEWGAADTMKLKGDERYRCKEPGYTEVNEVGETERRLDGGETCTVNCFKGAKPTVESVKCKCSKGKCKFPEHDCKPADWVMKLALGVGGSIAACCVLVVLAAVLG